jgi:ADP-heptose:LPS heptosyltransferase
MQSNSKSTLGYDTRSLRSALVMRTIDALNPFKRATPFQWRDHCVVSSTAGLGDLFIHLPLISGIVQGAAEFGVRVAVALRPAHVEIGRRCGWETLPFDNGLEDFFKNPTRFRPGRFIDTIRRTRQTPCDLWIDLTGSAVSALAIKAAGARQLAARITRGGRSLVDHPLPHLVQENEYDNRKRVAAHLGCHIDQALARRVVPVESDDHDPYVVLCLTTACRWKNWPVANFDALASSFPNMRFLVAGFRQEIETDDRAAFNQLLDRPNVVDAMDKLSAIQLMNVVARASAVITNDTSAAHIANFFGRPGAVLFGPVSPDTFASRDGLRVFHDATCPFHPCVQWRCRNESNWCMRKITVESVASHLGRILSAPAESKVEILELATERRAFSATELANDRASALTGAPSRWARAGAASSIGVGPE